MGAIPPYIATIYGKLAQSFTIDVVLRSLLSEMKLLVSIVLAAFCLVSIGQSAYASSMGRSAYGTTVTCHIEHLSPFDADVVISEDSIDPLFSMCELSASQDQVRSSSVPTPLNSGGLVGAYRIGTPRYIVVRRLLI